MSETKLKNQSLGITSTYIAPTLLNSWVNLDPATNPAGYCKDSNGFVHLRGAVSGGSGTIFTLPVGYRPAYDCIYIVITSYNVMGRCNVTASGNVSMAVGSNVWFLLDGITFLAEQ